MVAWAGCINGVHIPAASGKLVAGPPGLLLTGHIFRANYINGGGDEASEVLLDGIMQGNSDSDRCINYLQLG